MSEDTEHGDKTTREIEDLLGLLELSQGDVNNKLKPASGVNNITSDALTGQPITVVTSSYTDFALRQQAVQEVAKDNPSNIQEVAASHISEKAELSDEFKAFDESLIQNTEILVTIFKLIMSYIDHKEPDKGKLRELSIDELRELDENVIIWLRGYEHARLLRWLLGVTTTSSVDTFDHYLSQILFKVFTKQPDIFRASEDKAEVREFIEAGSIPEFMKRFAEKRVNELSYMGLPKIIEYLNNRLGLGFNMEDSSFQAACEFIEVRNILVHNAGEVNKLFLQRTGRTDLHEGDLYPLTFDYLRGKSIELASFTEKLDGMITSHFKLNQE